MRLLDLILADASEITDRSGKTSLDVQIDAWRALDSTGIEQELITALGSLDEDNWKQWRALRQLTWRLRLKGPNLADALAVLAEEGKPSDARARFYAYLARSDLNQPASMDELGADTDLREKRPSDWLYLVANQASPTLLHAEYLKLAPKLRHTDFNFRLPHLREKYGDRFVEWMVELCRAMPFVEAAELATMIDEEYHCGAYKEILAFHPSLKGQQEPAPAPAGESLWDGLPPEFRNRQIGKA